METFEMLKISHENDKIVEVNKFATRQRSRRQFIPHFYCMRIHVVRGKVMFSVVFLSIEGGPYPMMRYESILWCTGTGPTPRKDKARKDCPLGRTRARNDRSPRGCLGD